MGFLRGQTINSEVARAIETLDTADPAEVEAFREAKKRELEDRAKERAARAKAERQVAAKLEERTQQVRAQLDADEEAAKNEAARAVAEAQLRAEHGLRNANRGTPAKVGTNELEAFRRSHLGL